MGNALFIPPSNEPVSTTTETTTYALAAGQHAKIRAITFGAALVADGEELFPRLSFNTVADGVHANSTTTFTTALTGIDGHDLIGNMQVRGNGVSGAPIFQKIRATITGMDIVKDTFTGTTSTSWQDDAAIQEITLRAGDLIQLKSSVAANGVEMKYEFNPLTAPSESFWVSGGGSGITITGDTFIVELYNSIV